MKKVGYLEGTNSTYLTRLAVAGVDTLPLGNGADNHGKYVGFVDRSDEIDLVIAYFHKVVPLSAQNISPQSMLHACQLNDIPVLLIVPDELQEKARHLTKDVTAKIIMADPAKVIEKASEILQI